MPFSLTSLPHMQRLPRFPCSRSTDQQRQTGDPLPLVSSSTSISFMRLSPRSPGNQCSRRTIEIPLSLSLTRSSPPRLHCLSPALPLAFRLMECSSRVQVFDFSSRLRIKREIREEGRSACSSAAYQEAGQEIEVQTQEPREKRASHSPFIIIIPSDTRDARAID